MIAGRTIGRCASLVMAAAVALALTADVAVACPSCKEALSASDRWAAGFNASILFMMAMPFAVVAVVTGAIYRARRRPPETPGNPPAA